MTEIWRDIAGYEGLYQVSNFGRVRRLRKATPPYVLELRLDNKGYPRVFLSHDGEVKNKLVHRLVAQTFIPNPDSKPEVNHLNGDKTNNHVENLGWATRAENQQHAYDTGLRGSNGNNPLAKLTDAQVVYIRDNPDGLLGAELATMFSVDPATISGIQRGKVYRNAGGTIRTEKLYPHRILDEIRDEIRRLYVRGSHEFGSTALARKFGVNPQTVLNILKEATR